MTKKTVLITSLALLLLVAALYLALNFWVKSMVDERMDEFVAGGYYQSLDYDNVWVQPNGEITMKDLHVVDIDENEYIFQDITISEFDYFNTFPHHLKLTAEGMQFPGGPPQFGNLQESGWNTYLETVIEDDLLPIQLAYEYDYDPENAHRMNNDFRIGLPRSFLLTTNSVMDNIPVAQLNSLALGPGTSATQYSTSIQDGNVLEANISVQDLGVVPALLAAQGETIGLDPAEYREQLMVQLQTMALFAPQQLQFLAQELVLNFGEFLEGDKTLMISIKPEFGGNVQQLQGEVMGAFYIGNFERIVDVLNLESDTD